MLPVVPVTFIVLIILLVYNIKLFMILSSIIVCITIYWYINSLKPYQPNKGLKFDLPPTNIYPFKHKWLNQKTFQFIDTTEEVKTCNDPVIHYIDEIPPNIKSDTPTIIMFHGNPTWSFLYRKLIIYLSKYYRCICIDYPGFGLSTAFSNYKFRPIDHALIITKLIKKLNVNNVITIHQDWGGPIGLKFCCDKEIINNKTVIGFIIGNTWAWPLKNRWQVKIFSLIWGGFLGFSLGYGFNFVINNFFKVCLPYIIIILHILNVSINIVGFFQKIKNEYIKMVY